MGWRESYLDLILIPFSLLLSISYQWWLRYKVRSQPMQTIVGIHSAAQRIWVLGIMKDNEKKSIIAIQSIRNAVMSSTLMATTSILISTGLAAVISSTYSVKEPVNASIYGAHGKHMTAFKYVVILFILLLAFLCYSLSIRFMNHVNILINIPCGIEAFPLEPEYVCEVMETGSALNNVGNRLFYTALPLLLWISGPVLVILFSVAGVIVQYRMDFVFQETKNTKWGCWKI